MAKSRDDIKYATAQAKLSDDESLRVAYKHGTPLESGKIAVSETVDLFSSAHNISHHSSADRSAMAARSQLIGEGDNGGGDGGGSDAANRNGNSR